MAKCDCTYLPAKFRFKLTLQTLVRTPDGQGGFTEAWSDSASVWASLEPVKAYEKFQAMQMQTPVSHKIVTRYRGDVTSASRFRYGDRTFWVKEAINVNEDNRYLQIKALERT